jgi:predicted nicotinamide N-methyase
MSGHVNDISFSFGENWMNYLKHINEERIAESREDIDAWLPVGMVENRRVLDIGSGSGISSLCMHRRGASEVRSFDYDDASVQSTRLIAQQFAGAPPNWLISSGSVLDVDFMNSLGTYDLVHAWGVLMHTGDLELALKNTFARCASGGHVMLAIYQAGHKYTEDLQLKQDFNKADKHTQERMALEHARRMYPQFAQTEDILAQLRNTPASRGMNLYNDLMDWLGGLPYEVAYPSDIMLNALEWGLVPMRLMESNQGGCSVMLFHRPEKADSKSLFLWSRHGQPEVTEVRTLRQQLKQDLAQLNAQLAGKVRQEANRADAPLADIVKHRVLRKLGIGFD